VAQVLKHLLCKHKALSSNFSPIQKKKKERERGGTKVLICMAWMDLEDSTQVKEARHRRPQQMIPFVGNVHTR
jgi:hypothetical protein